MSSPFDFAKSILQTKEDLYTVEEIFNKEYAPFMVNRILSNSERTVFFAECMDKYNALDKKLQYDFFLKGIPKSSGFQKMWSKKESSELNIDHINFICEEMNVSFKRGSEIYQMIGPSVVEDSLSKRGGRTTGNGKQK